MATPALTETHEAVQKLYAEAANAPQPGLCCPKDYTENWTSHIPKDALERNYGCGSPVLKAGIQEGEVVVDLGSGVGIDCFVAAKFVGASGKVYGVDMTGDMLAKAREYNKEVAANLGYDSVQFLEGRIESIPLPDHCVDVVVSNCVINLSPDKDAVFADIKRVLKDGGRVVIADIVSDREVDEASRGDEQLWAECYTGALSVPKFIQAFGDAGFQAVSQIAESPWTDVNGYRFASLTIQAYNYLPGDACIYEGRMGIYLGPYASVKDDEGHEFPRFRPVEVCSDTARRLQNAPYRDVFLVTGATRKASGQASDGSSCCAPAESAGGSCCDSRSAGKSGGCC